jgi:hypothetical protein
VRLSGSVVCSSVRQQCCSACVAVYTALCSCAAVCGSSCGCALQCVRVPVCGNTYLCGSVWQCALHTLGCPDILQCAWQCAAVRQCGISVSPQCVAVRAALCDEYEFM